MLHRNNEYMYFGVHTLRKIEVWIHVIVVVYGKTENEERLSSDRNSAFKILAKKLKTLLKTLKRATANVLVER